jgi:lysozyme
MSHDPREVIPMLKHHEGVRQRPYLCPAHLWTVGVGRVLYPEQIKLPVVRTAEKPAALIRREFKLKPEDDRLWTMEEVDELLAQDLARFSRGVLRLLTVEPRRGQFLACVSFAFNAGLGALQRSTIRMKHNRGDFEGAAQAFMAWTKGGGKVWPGLVKRRQDERALYLS